VTAAVEAQFLRRLEALHYGGQAASQYLAAHLAISRLASKRPRVLAHVEKHSEFWIVVQNSLQVSFVMAVGRVFDPKPRSPYTIGHLLNFAAEHREVLFSRAALRKRKCARGPEPKWLPDYIAKAHEATTADIHDLRDRTKELRHIYEDQLEPLRNRVFAHPELMDDNAIARLFAATKVKDLKRLVIGLLELHRALDWLFVDGRKPVFGSVRFSARPVPDAALSNRRYERVVFQARAVLLAASRARRTPTR
jgi:hypothetical protein